MNETAILRNKPDTICWLAGRQCVGMISRYLLTICLVLGASPQFAAADRLEEFKDSRREMVQLLRSKQASDRIDAIGRLQKFPLEDAVKLIHGALDDPEPDVRQAAYDTLIQMNGNFEVCEALLALAKRELHGRDGAAGAVAPIAILLTSQLRSTRRDVDELLTDVASSRAGAIPIVLLIDALAARRMAQDVAVLEQLTHTKVFENHRGIRRAVVQALARIPSKQSIDLLIKIMDRAGGEGRADAVEHLTQVTGQIFGMEVAAWRRWWSDAAETFHYRSTTVEKKYRSTLTESEAGYYYGLPLFAERVVFVIDTSGSMGEFNGRRISAAKRELIKAVRGLPPYVSFNIVAFNTRIDFWQRKLVPANVMFKKAAIDYIASQVPSSSTASYDALAAAMSLDTEAIYFLSDGEPTAGKIVAPVDIVAAVTATNKVRRISIYTIGIGAGFPGSPLDVFLRTLAEQNLGLYRRVDN